MGAEVALTEDLAALWGLDIGRPVSNTWRNNLGRGFSYVNVGGSGSHQIPRLANAVGLFEGDPGERSECAAWFREASQSEIERPEVAGKKWCFQAFELFSGTYEQWSGAAEASAMLSIRADKEMNASLKADANAWLTRYLAHRFLLWALRSRYRIIFRRSNGNVFYQGPGTLNCGLRGKTGFPLMNLLGTYAALDEEPDTDKLNPEDPTNYLCKVIPEVGLGGMLKRCCRELMGDTWDMDTIKEVGPYWLAAMPSVPCEIRTSRGGERQIMLTSHIEGGNTGACWGAYITGAEGKQSAYPYTRDRIRGGDPELGRGHADLTPDRYFCENLTDKEAEKPGKGPQISQSFDLIQDPDIQLIMDPLGNKLYINGERWEG